ncbi:c-type cytochrome biogenesis protein CcsB [Pseudokineococcus lusitanus]|uniref:Cytochrome c-type biogenesis protein CcsB n=1 Tax=Pseudokineococcus lusitanus TaxID=763993 RepID=A0A3N1HLD2_9ACTN|nr:c-type cytochrome biogenesis protein CcsB [Pseudokineococcus lusitanus]ROP43276.1 cytochrome c-type biogenesis protein CcsB [Pseudokineococcus lusitanus]
MDASLAATSNLLVYSAMSVYVLAFVAFALDLSGRGRTREVVAGATARSRTLVGAGGAGEDTATATEGGDVVRVRRGAAAVGVTTTWLALLLHGAAVVTRGLSAHRVPWGNMYEFSLTGSAVVTAVFCVVLLRRDLRYLGVFVVGPVLLSLGVALAVLYTESAQLVPALQSYWLVIHVSVAAVSSALFVIAFSANVLQLVQDRRERMAAAGRPARRGAFMERLPGSVELERAAYRLIAVSFPLWSFTLVAGAIWAERAWGRYWGWDPKEVWTFVIWVVYAAYLHARATRGWDGRRSAYLAIAGFACILVNYGVVNVFFPGEHSYAGIG